MELKDERMFYNGQIIATICNILCNHPDLRFCQLLSILHLDDDHFYEESKTTYCRILSEYNGSTMNDIVDMYNK